MKTFKDIQKKRLEVQDDTMAYISAADLKKYKEVTDKFISNDTKDIIDWLIVNNASYTAELPGADQEENSLAGFYNNGKPTKENLLELWTRIDNVVKSGRALEIPVFLTQQQFADVCSKKISLDNIVIDFDDEKTRNELVKKYQPLIWKIVNQWNSKTVMSKEDIYSAALEGFTYAMNTYGKKSKKRLKQEETMTPEEIEEFEKKLHSSMTFGQYAAFMVRTYITEEIKDMSRTVRVARSAQQKEKKTNGSIKSVNTISGDSIATTNKDGNSKTVFDFIGTVDDAGKSLDNEDLDKLWAKVYDKLEQKFDKKIMDIWYSYNGINGYKQLENKELAKKYGVVPSNITYYLTKVNMYIRKDKELYKMMTDIYELMKECLNDLDREGDDYDMIYTSVNTDIDNMSDLDFNEIY